MLNFETYFFRSHAFMNWSADVESQLKVTCDNVRILMSQFEARHTNAVLQDMFGSRSLCLSVNDNVMIAESVQTVMTHLSSEVTKQDSILGGALVGVRSFWDGTRIGEAPNEFDYMYVLSGVNRYITGCYECSIGKYRLTCKQINPLTGTPDVLSNFALRECFCVCINKTMRRISLPRISTTVV